MNITSMNLKKPDHEAVALNAVIQLSRKYGKRKMENKFYALLAPVGVMRSVKEKTFHHGKWIWS